jgi:hypothetical protein
MTLTLIFLDITHFDMYLSTYDGSELRLREEENEELGEESQSVCGKLFRELWSDDSEGGFPMPTGCYHRPLGSHGGDTLREVVIVFEPRNGLRGGQDYQIVMNVYATSGFDKNRELILVNSIDDLYAARYSSLEVGHAYSSKSYQSPAGQNDPKFAFEDGHYPLLLLSTPMSSHKWLSQSQSQSRSQTLSGRLPP